MGMKLFDVHGVALDEQTFSWREMAGQPISKLDDDALTRVRIILMSSIEAQSLHFQHACASMNSELRAALATVRRVEHHQQTLLNWLLSPDHSPLEVTVANEQAAIEVLAALAQQEVDPYLAQVYRFVLLEDCDHLYRLAALMDRVEGRDANNILQSYTDIRPGRPTPVQHSHPSDDLRTPYQRSAVPSSKLHVRIAMALKNQTRDHYLAAGPTRADPMARRLYAEIASVEEQHATQFTSLVDPDESWLEQWILQEATELYSYYSCAQAESNLAVRAIWERFYRYEQGHLDLAMNLYKKHERRDPAAVLPDIFPDPIPFQGNREFVRRVLSEEIDLRSDGAQFIPQHQQQRASTVSQDQLNAEGSPSDQVAAGYQWRPGTELSRPDAVAR